MTSGSVQILNAELIPIYPFLALLGDHNFLHINRIRAKFTKL